MTADRPKLLLAFSRLVSTRRLSTGSAVRRSRLRRWFFLLQAPDFGGALQRQQQLSGCQGLSRYCQMPASLTPVMMSSASV